MHTGSRDSPSRPGYRPRAARLPVGGRSSWTGRTVTTMQAQPERECPVWAEYEQAAAAMVADLAANPDPDVDPADVWAMARAEFTAAALAAGGLL